MKQQNSNDQSPLNVIEQKNKDWIQIGLHLLNIFGVIVTIYVLYWGFKHEIFTSEEALRNLLFTMGPAAPFGFIFIQIIQTVIPVIPGALTIPMGSMIFGMKYGFLLNFIGIMIGSVMNFILARKFGRPLVEMIVDEKQLYKYSNWLDDNNRFDKLFTFGMFFPLSPADFLCYLAGLSNISFNKYLLILTAGKPLTLFIYSYGTMSILGLFFRFIG